MVKLRSNNSCQHVSSHVARLTVEPRLMLPSLQHMRGVTDGSCVGQFRWPPKFGGRRCERGCAATRECSRVVEARSGACFFNRVQVRWTQLCAQGNRQRLGPVRAPHMARSAIVFRHSDTFSNAIDDGLDVAMLTTRWTFSHARQPTGKQPTRTKQRPRIPKIATALVRLNPDLAKSVTKRSRLPCGPRVPSPSCGEERAPPPNPE